MVDHQIEGETLVLTTEERIFRFRSMGNIEPKMTDDGTIFMDKPQTRYKNLKGLSYNKHRISERDYSPQMIQNPAANVMDTDEWFVESQSYYVKHI